MPTRLPDAPPRPLPLTMAPAPTLPWPEQDTEQAFEAFYRRRWPQVMDFARYRLAGEAEAEDAAAETFSRAWALRGRFDARLGSAEAWLFGIARHVVQNQRRRWWRRRPELPLEAGAGAADPGLEAAEAGLDWPALRQALGGLKRLDQEIIALRFGAGLDHRGIAQALGQGEANVALRLHRGLRRLRTILEAEP